MSDFRVVVPCNLIEVYHPLRGSCCPEDGGSGNLKPIHNCRHKKILVAMRNIPFSSHTVRSVCCELVWNFVVCDNSKSRRGHRRYDPRDLLEEILIEIRWRRGEVWASNMCLEDRVHTFALFMKTFRLVKPWLSLRRTGKINNLFFMYVTATQGEIRRV